MSSAPIGLIVAGAIGSFGGSSSGKKTNRKIGSIIANITIRERHQDDLEITDHPVEQGAQISDHAFKRPAEVTIEVAWSNSISKPSTLVGNISNALINRVSGQIQNAVTSAAQKAIGGSALGNLAVGKLGDLANLGLSALSQTNTGTGKGTSAVQDIYQQLLKLQAARTLIDIYTGKRVYSSMLIRQITTETSKETENALFCTLVCRQVIIVKTKTVSVTASASAQAAPEKTAPTEDAGTKQAEPVAVSDVQRQIALQNAWNKSKYSN